MNNKERLLLQITASLLGLLIQNLAAGEGLEELLGPVDTLSLALVSAIGSGKGETLQ